MQTPDYLQKLPRELWMSVFKLLQRSDLLAVAVTNRLFYDLSIPSFYRHLKWLNVKSYARNSSAWVENHTLNHYPTSLTMSLPLFIAGELSSERGYRPRYDPDNDPGLDHTMKWVVDVDDSPTSGFSVVNARRFAPHSEFSPLLVSLGNSFPLDEAEQVLMRAGSEMERLQRVRHEVTWLLTRRTFEFYCTHALLQKAYDQVARFTNLRELILQGMSVADHVFDIVQVLPKLEVFRIRECRIRPLGPGDIFSYSGLGLKTLEIAKAHIEFGGELCSSYGIPCHAVRLVKLATCPNIQDLSIDWTKYAAIVLSPRSDPALDCQISPNLRALSVRLTLTRPGREDPTPQNGEAELAFLEQSLKEFWKKCGGVEKLTVPALTRSLRTSPIFQNLRSFIGCPFSVGLRFNSDHLRHLEIVYGEANASNLHQLSRHVKNLESLRFELPQWDDEVLYVIGKFRRLQKLVVTYRSGVPSEQTLLSMGPEFFQGKTTQLVSVGIYSPGQKHMCWSMIRRLGHTALSPQSEYVTSLCMGCILLDPPAEACEDDSFASFSQENEDDVKEFVLPWNRCSSVREVQLVDGSVWIRAHPRGSWLKREIEESDGNRALAYYEYV